MKKSPKLFLPKPNKVLYVGTTEILAKEAARNGLNPPVYLTDVYPGFFALMSATDDKQKLGIIEINIEMLLLDKFAPFHGYIERLTRPKRKKLNDDQIWHRRGQILKDISIHHEKWEKSLEDCGVCLYLLKIPAQAVNKVTTYYPYDKSGNEFVNNIITKFDPWDNSHEQHKENYNLCKVITKWLVCEPFDTKVLNGSQDQMNNRQGLDLYYQNNYKDGHAWWRA